MRDTSTNVNDNERNWYAHSWFDQHRRLAKLNLQAHQSAMARSDEYVLEALLTFDKLGVVVHELLAIEAWKEVGVSQNRTFTRLLTHPVSDTVCVLHPESYITATNYGIEARESYQTRQVRRKK